VSPRGIVKAASLGNGTRGQQHHHENVAGESVRKMGKSVRSIRNLWCGEPHIVHEPFSSCFTSSGRHLKSTAHTGNPHPNMSTTFIGRSSPEDEVCSEIPISACFCVKQFHRGGNGGGVRVYILVFSVWCLVFGVWCLTCVSVLVLVLALVLRLL
jgi:hypothetical protein